MERENSVPEDRPPVNISHSHGTYSEEEWLQDQGVNPTRSENQEMRRISEPLKEFHSKWLNEPPTEEAIASILPLLREAYTAIKSGTEADKEVVDRLWYWVTACAAVLCRVADRPSSHLFNFCRKVLLAAAKHELPTPDSECHTEFKSSSYSPCPRHEAASGLLRLTARQSDLDSEILDEIKSSQMTLFHLFEW